MSIAKKVCFCTAKERFQKCERGGYSLIVRSLGLPTSIWLGSEIVRRRQL